MSVSLKEVIEASDYDLTTKEDCEWLLAKKDEFEELCNQAEETIDTIEEEEQQAKDIADSDYYDELTSQGETGVGL